MILRGSPIAVSASAQGTERYAVTIEVHGPKLVASCECPYAESDLCKHIWGALKVAEREGHLSRTLRTSSVRLTSPSSEAFSRTDATPANDSAFDLEDELLVPHRGSTTAKGRSAGRAWMHLVSDAQSHARRSLEGQTHWANRDIVYVIGSASSTSGGSLPIQVFEKSQGKAQWKALSIPPSGTPFLPREDDRLLLGLFASRQVTSGYGTSYESPIPSRIALPVATAMPILLQVLRTGRTYWGAPPEGDSPAKPHHIG
jgi:hypothetical protein